MNIIEVLNLEPGTKVIDDKGDKYYVADDNAGIVPEESYLDYKEENKMKVLCLAVINKTLANREFGIIGKFKKGDKVYIDWFFDTEGLDEAEFLRYYPDGIFAQILIETEEKFLIQEVKIERIFEHK